MRIACICKLGTANAYYRAELPLRELQRRGHTIVSPSAEQLRHESHRRPDCDLLHLQQVAEPGDLEMIERMRRWGIAVVWDSDDDALDVPKFSPAYKRLGGRRGVRRHAARCAALASAAHLMTTPSDGLAQLYRRAGAERVQVIENHLADADLGRARRPRTGVVIGCTAALEHRSDLDALSIPTVLRTLMDRHDDVHVIAIGNDLGLDGPRYSHYPRVAIEDLVRHESAFDIGIAPLVDSRFNRARSNVKLKEYASAGAAWLASPVGPYIGMGEAQGGQLVEPDRWLEALDDLVSDPTRRSDLARRGREWARAQTIRRAGDAWEGAFEDALARARRAVA